VQNAVEFISSRSAKAQRFTVPMLQDDGASARIAVLAIPMTREATISTRVLCPQLVRIIDKDAFQQAMHVVLDRILQGMFHVISPFKSEIRSP
jgi:hypothetical protein